MSTLNAKNSAGTTKSYTLLETDPGSLFRKFCLQTYIGSATKYVMGVANGAPTLEATGSDSGYSYSKCTLTETPGELWVFHAEGTTSVTFYRRRYTIATDTYGSKNSIGSLSDGAGTGCRLEDAVRSSTGVLVVVGIQTTSTQERLLIVESTDNGASWSDKVTINDANIKNAVLEELADGRILMITNGSARVRSTGGTWSTFTPPVTNIAPREMFTHPYSGLTYFFYTIFQTGTDPTYYRTYNGSTWSSAYAINVSTTESSLTAIPNGAGLSLIGGSGLYRIFPDNTVQAATRANMYRAQKGCVDWTNQKLYSFDAVTDVLFRTYDLASWAEANSSTALTRAGIYLQQTDRKLVLV